MASKQVGPELPEGLSQVSTEAPRGVAEPEIVKSLPLSDGPIKGPKGEYRPSRYPVTTVLPSGKEHTVIVEDR